jgi:hypothetical protein
MIHARSILGGAMFLVVCSAVAALACRDIERPADQRGLKPVREQEGPPVILALTCELIGENKTVSCSTPPAIPAGVSASVIYGSAPGYAQFYPVSLVKDTVAQTWQFTAYLQNLLKQSIGTLNGTTVTGVKVFISDFHATAGTGTVSVANADGVGNFTAPNQPFFNYNQIVAPSGYTSNKLWKFNVPNTVTAVSMSILISTDFPAEQNVTLAQPSSVPDWVRSDTNISISGAIGIKHAKRVLKVFFKPSATLADRQLAIAYVNGAVIGGLLESDGSGYYVVQVLGAGLDTAVVTARNRLAGLPQVRLAVPWSFLSASQLTPIDGGDYTHWRLSPDSADLNSHRWALEMLDAPYAWGCSVGAASTIIGVIDIGFHALPSLRGNTDPTQAAWDIVNDTVDHGTSVSSTLADVGNDGLGMTGTMWHAKVLVRNASYDSVNHKLYSTVDTYSTGKHIVSLSLAGARVVNMSLGIEYRDSLSPHGYRTPGSWPTDDSTSRWQFQELMSGIRDGEDLLAYHTLPLLVVAAGNFKQTGANANNDAWWSVLPRLADSLHDTVIVVGASTQARTIALFSGVNTVTGAHQHQYVDIMAPGDEAPTWTAFPLPNGLTATGEGTSFAAPYVTGAAGLLMSFDPILGSPIPMHGPPELKSLILAGADSNTSPDGTVRRANGYRFLSLYKPLVLAAKRVGAPLCGNRIWQFYDGASYTVSAERGTSSEVLHSGPGHPQITVLHTTRDIDIENGTRESGNRITWNPVTRVWNLRSRLAADTAGFGLSNYYGAAISPDMWSHSHDTMFVVTSVTGNVVNMGLRVYSNANSFADTPLISSDSLIPIAYSPRGDRVLLSNPSGMYTAVPVPGQALTSLKKIYTNPSNTTVWSTGISEDGRVLMVAEQNNVLPGRCTIKYKSMYTGLDVATAHDGGIVCNLKNGFAPRWAGLGAGF